eukprot:TRINITY_DN7478_c0_g1_i1.p1 TRINITY_DN7478_c0_g1~~TRINITY_DN7478_c0_g1_i1.p1  ORF type:complete len:533 (-),score=116.89 TRINITY_DN7478_c0_g1_i1:48-1646(-)
MLKAFVSAFSVVSRHSNNPFHFSGVMRLGKEMLSPKLHQVCFRPYSESGTAPILLNDLPSLDQSIKDVYRKIHPDFFAAFPEARASNQNAVKDIKEFLADWRKRRLSLRWSPRTYKISFFTKDEQSGSTDPIRKIDLDLSLSSSNEAITSVQKILRSLGISDQFSVDDDFSFSTQDMKSSLTDFLFHYGKRVQVMKKELEKLRREIDPLKTSLETTLELHELDISQLYMRETLPILSQLSEIVEPLQAKKLSLNGLTIYMDESTRADAQTGIIRLNWKDTPQTWVDFLLTLDLDALRASYEQHRTMRDKSIDETKQRSAKAASAIGVSSIYIYEHSYQEEEEDEPYTKEIDNLEQKNRLNTVDRYNMFLLAAIGHKIPKNAPSSVLRKNKKVELNIDCSKDPQLRIDRDGTLVVPWSMPISDLMKTLESEALSITGCRKSADDLDTIRRYVGVRLGLTDLAVEPSFYLRMEEPAKKERLALVRLQENVEMLRKFELSGLEIAISDEYKVGQDGILYIKWDFDLEKLGGLLGN